MITIMGKKTFSAIDYPTFEEYLYSIMEWLEANNIQSVEIKYNE